MKFLWTERHDLVSIAVAVFLPLRMYRQVPRYPIRGSIVLLLAKMIPYMMPPRMNWVYCTSCRERSPVSARKVFHNSIEKLPFRCVRMILVMLERLFVALSRRHLEDDDG